MSIFFYVQLFSIRVLYRKILMGQAYDILVKFRSYKGSEILESLPRREKFLAVFCPLRWFEFNDDDGQLCPSLFVVDKVSSSWTQQSMKSICSLPQNYTQCVYYRRNVQFRNALWSIFSGNGSAISYNIDSSAQFYEILYLQWDAFAYVADWVHWRLGVSVLLF